MDSFCLFNSQISLCVWSVCLAGKTPLLICVIHDTCNTIIAIKVKENDPQKIAETILYIEQGGFIIHLCTQKWTEW